MTNNYFGLTYLWWDKLATAKRTMFILSVLHIAVFQNRSNKGPSFSAMFASELNCDKMDLPKLNQK